ncbi:hypothetical protein [Anaplasma platys]|uniref:hypothetical protein n=1 Tax=Anaplasma platys TaxID=949 RepID=UPI00145EADCA|nr:hypothetical protein [Anaplasma platys]
MAGSVIGLKHAVEDTEFLQSMQASSTCFYIAEIFREFAGKGAGSASLKTPDVCSLSHALLTRFDHVIC